MVGGCGLYAPCMGLFFPVFLEGELPAQLSIGEAERTDDSPWWKFHDLTESGVAESRDAWSSLQEELNTVLCPNKKVRPVVRRSITSAI